MAFFQSIAEFFSNIFMASSPEVKKRQALKKIENELRNSTPLIYKNEMILPNFAEALRLLFVNTKPVYDILSDTICSEDFERNRHFTEQLLLTGFPVEIQDVMETLSYENRKVRARESDSLTRSMEMEHRQLEKILKHLNTPDFIRIDTVLDRIKQLGDICKFSYMTALRIFDVNYSTSSVSPNFQAVPAELLESSVTDLYYVVAGMDISTSTCNAIIALNQLYHKGNVTAEQNAQLTSSLKKIQSLLRHVFTEENLINLIKIGKKNPDFTPEKASYEGNYRKKYADYLEDRFNVESNRLKTELQDELITTEVAQLFGNNPLAHVNGYNNELNATLKAGSPQSFTLTVPVQILKTFLQMYYDGHVKPLLNDIAIEGYFNTPAYKSDFASNVYAVNESMERIKKFEEKFQRNAAFDEAVISSLIRDSHKDTSFQNKLKEIVDSVNKAAKDLLQTEVNNIFHVYKVVGEILLESKKANSDIITNLKVLMLSSRNRDNSELLEKQYGLWRVFLDVMKNYVILTNSEKGK